MGCQDVRTTLWKARANSETDRVSDKLFTGFLEGASAIFQSVKVAFLPSEQCLIVVCVSVCVCVCVCFRVRAERAQERVRRHNNFLCKNAVTNI